MFDVDCTQLRVGQFICPAQPDIDPLTQQPVNCSINNTAPLTCHLIEGLRCLETDTSNRLNDTHFVIRQQCLHTEGHSFQTTLLLAVFLGMFGADRFYLGYYAFGLLKFCTFGFMLVGQLLDVILIATHVLRPASGSYYVTDYFGPKMNLTGIQRFMTPTFKRLHEITMGLRHFQEELEASQLGFLMSASDDIDNV